MGNRGEEKIKQEREKEKERERERGCRGREAREEIVVRRSQTSALRSSQQIFAQTIQTTVVFSSKVALALSEYLRTSEYLLSKLVFFVAIQTTKLVSSLRPAQPVPVLHLPAFVLYLQVLPTRLNSYTLP